MEKETKRKEEEIRVLIDMQILFMICITIVNTFLLFEFKVLITIEMHFIYRDCKFLMKCMKY